MVWFSRFELYRLQGPDRSIEEAFRQARQNEAKCSTGRPTNPWYRTAEKWNWKSRAEAWDQTVLEQRRWDEEQQRERARRRRIVLARKLQRAGGALIAKGLSKEEIEALPTGEARRLLPVADRMVMDGMQAERLELGLPTQRTDVTTAGKAVAVALPISAEDVEQYHLALEEGFKVLAMRQQSAGAEAQGSENTGESEAESSQEMAGPEAGVDG